MEHCMLCPRRCGARRTASEGNGFCRMGELPVVVRAAPHFGEEPCLTGTCGSGAVFFCGCSLGCIFCQNSDISRGKANGEMLTSAQLADVFRNLGAKGVHNLNLVTATHFAPAVAEALRLAKPSIPVIWNCGGYETPETIAMLDGLVNIYLPDFKYADSDIAAFCAKAPDYPEIALSAIRLMREQTGPAVYDENGIMQSGTMVRHLVLPGLTGHSLRALNLLRDALPEDVPLSLMGQYTPCVPNLPHPLDSVLPRKAYKTVEAHANMLGFGGYRQLPGAQGTQMIPLWDKTGILPLENS